MMGSSVGARVMLLQRVATATTIVQQAAAVERAATTRNLLAAMQSAGGSSAGLLAATSPRLPPAPLRRAGEAPARLGAPGTPPLAGSSPIGYRASPGGDAPSALVAGEDAVREPPRLKRHRRSLSEPKSMAALLEASKDLLGVTKLGVVVEVKLHRGGRQLTIKSAVEVVNETGVALLFTMPSSQATAADASEIMPELKELRVEPGETASLPLRFTSNGSDHACKHLQARPAALTSGFAWGSLESLSPGISFLSCDSAPPQPLPPSKDARAAFARSPVAPSPTDKSPGGGVNGSSDSSSRNWMCCARVDYLSTAQVNARGLHRVESHGAHAVRRARCPRHAPRAVPTPCTARCSSYSSRRRADRRPPRCASAPTCAASLWSRPSSCCTRTRACSPPPPPAAPA